MKQAMNLSSAAKVVIVREKIPASGVVEWLLADQVHWRPHQTGKTHQSLCLGLVKGAEALAWLTTGLEVLQLLEHMCLSDSQPPGGRVASILNLPQKAYWEEPEPHWAASQ